MIENTSTLNRADMKFMIQQNNRSIVQYLRRLVALAYGLFLVGFAIWLAIMHSSFAYWTNTFMTIFGITMGPWFIIQAIFHKQLMLRKALKNKEFLAPRRYQVDTNSITMQTIISGAEVTNRFVASTAECFWACSDTIYIRLKMDKKSIYYLCFHDNGYTQGNRSELLKLLGALSILEKNP